MASEVESVVEPQHSPDPTVDADSAAPDGAVDPGQACEVPSEENSKTPQDRAEPENDIPVISSAEEANVEAETNEHTEQPIQEALVALSTDELLQMASQLDAGVNHVNNQLRELEEEKNRLQDEGKQLREAVELMMKEMHKLNIGAGNIVEPKLHEGPLDFIPRYIEMMTPKNNGVQVSEHIGELRRQPVVASPDEPTMSLQRLLSTTSEQFKESIGEIREITSEVKDQLRDRLADVQPNERFSDMRGKFLEQRQELQLAAAQRFSVASERLSEASDRLRTQSAEFHTVASGRLSIASEKLLEAKEKLKTQGSELWSQPPTQRFAGARRSVSDARDNLRAKGLELWNQPPRRDSGASRPPQAAPDAQPWWKRAASRWQAPEADASAASASQSSSPADAPEADASAASASLASSSPDDRPNIPAEDVVVEAVGEPTQAQIQQTVQEILAEGTEHKANVQVSEQKDEAVKPAGDDEPELSSAAAHEEQLEAPAEAADEAEEDGNIIEAVIVLPEGKQESICIGATDSIKAVVAAFVTTNSLEDSDKGALKRFLMDVEENAETLPSRVQADLEEIRNKFGEAA
mmetsp:Transcript_43619/g.115223  ORF Transcript_43619/g.115223 Transcript_43619/m.115223 type:complete len:580 (-) Transcript_43619:442-2181(-)